MPHQNSHRRRRLGVVMLVTAVLSGITTMLASPASAASSWHFGPLVETVINDCFTSDVVYGSAEYAGAQYDAATPPLGGAVVYVETVLTGVDSSCGQYALPDISLPAGTRTAISAAHPIKCFTYNNSTQVQTPDTADCPSTLGPALSGGTGSIRNRHGSAPGFWNLNGNATYMVWVPITSATTGWKTIAFPARVVSGSPTGSAQTLRATVSVPFLALNPASAVTAPRALTHAAAITRGARVTLSINRVSTIGMTWQAKVNGVFRTISTAFGRNLAAGPLAATLRVPVAHRWMVSRPAWTRMVVRVDPQRGPTVAVTRWVWVGR
ncbi:MAG: hypothetical protein ACRDVG_09590 [Jatrophihabitantaceae bacterium]